MVATLWNFSNAPFADDWGMPGLLYEKLLSGRLGPPDLWLQHNESRMVFPRLWLLLTGAVWGFHALPGVLTAFGLMMLAWLWTTRPWSAVRTAGDKGRFGLALVGSWLIFTPAAWEFLPWAIHFAAQVPVAALLFALAVQRSPGSYPVQVLFCAGAALVATFSFTHGLIVWGLAAPLLWRLASRTGGMFTWADAAYLAAGLGAAVFYAIGYVTPAHHPDLIRHSPGFLSYLRFLAKWAGAPLAHWSASPESTALLIGSGLGLLSAWALWTARDAWRGASSEARHWTALLLYGWITGAAAAYGRTQFSEAFALSSRYAALACWIPLGALGLLWSVRGASRSFWLSAVAVGALALAAWPPGLRSLSARQDELQQDALTLRALPLLTADPQVGRIVLGRERTLEMLRLFGAHGWLRPPPLDWAVEAARAPLTDHGGWLTVEPGANGAGRRLQGWAMLPDPPRPAPAVLLARRRANGTLEPVTFLRPCRPRPDVATALRHRALGRSGFEIELPASDTGDDAWVAFALDERDQVVHALRRQAP
ncbi:MAG: hypothetical protein JSR82_08365 [Verrucomicrobia bacterium]|nr:hypothetical protein [Verrucomicrobiota bacterium]